MNRHHRFLVAFAFGLGISGCSFVLPLGLDLHALLAVDAFCLCYLVLMFQLARKAGPAHFRQTVGSADEGIGLIVILAALTVAASVTGIVLVLNGPSGDGLAARLAALASVPLGWAMVHTLAAFHYAHLHYQPGRGEVAAGLGFPGGKDPAAWDFVYFAFVIGMAAQVSDVMVMTTRMRRVVLVHSVTAFFYNTVILALAVNAAVTIAG